MIDLSYYKKAIKAAEEEREQVIFKLKELEIHRKRLSQLESFIEKGKALLSQENVGDSPDGLSALPEQTNSSKFTQEGLSFIKENSQMPNHMKVAKVLKEVGRPMTLAELEAEFEKRNWKLSKNNPRGVLRGCFIQHPEMFSQEIRKEGGIPRGYYSLKQQEKLQT